MGICLALVRISDETIEELRTDPKRALHFWMRDEVPEPISPNWFARLLGAQKKPLSKCTAIREEDDETDLDKAWDAMDYLLSKRRTVSGVARFLTVGGEKIPEEVGYGPPRVFRSVEVNKIADFLATITDEFLRVHYDGQLMDDAKIYPQIWSRDGDEGLEYVLNFLNPLRDFVQGAAKRGDGLMIVYT
jgi:hypothetical protein